MVRYCRILRAPAVLPAVGIFLTATVTDDVVAQTCPHPPADCAGALHCGGEWDFENGFVFVPHVLAGQCASPPGGGHESCVPSDRLAHVAVGWHHWAAFPDWPTPGYHGHAAFNENKNCDNVHRGNRSQEITLTCANGIGLIYRQAVVPEGHLIRVRANMRFTPNDPSFPDVEHDLGIDLTGGTDPTAASVQWFPWDAQNGNLPPGAFNLTTEDVVATGPVMTVFIRMLAREPPCMGQTFMIDNVRIDDLGAVGPVIDRAPAALLPAQIITLPIADQTFTVRNAGAGTLNYTVEADQAWLSVAPGSGSSSGQMDTFTASYDPSSLSVGDHPATISILSNDATNSPQTIAVTLTLKRKPGDYDLDGDVDLDDYARFQACYSGSGVTQTDPDCAWADMDGDNDVDPADFDLFRGCLSGPGVPSDPHCAP